MGGGVAEVVKEVATGSDACTPAFVLFWSVVNHVARVSYTFMWWDFMLENPVEDINSVDRTVALK